MKNRNHTNRIPSLLLLLLLIPAMLYAQEVNDSLKIDSLRLFPPRIETLEIPEIGVTKENNSIVKQNISDMRSVKLQGVVAPRIPMSYRPGYFFSAPYRESFNDFTMGMYLSAGTYGLPILGNINMISPYLWANPGDKLGFKLGVNMMQYANLSYINNIVTPYLPMGSDLIHQFYLHGHYDLTPWFRVLGEAEHTMKGNFPAHFGMFLPPDQRLSIGGAVKLVGNFGVAVKRDFEFYNGKMVPRTRIEPYFFDNQNQKPYVSKKERALRRVKIAYE